MHHLPKTCCLHNPQCVSVTDLGECDGRRNGDHIATEKNRCQSKQGGMFALHHPARGPFESEDALRAGSGQCIKQRETPGSGSENGDVTNLLPFSLSQSQQEESDQLRRSEGSPLTHPSNINKNLNF